MFIFVSVSLVTVAFGTNSSSRFGPPRSSSKRNCFKFQYQGASTTPAINLMFPEANDNPRIGSGVVLEPEGPCSSSTTPAMSSPGRPHGPAMSCTEARRYCMLRRTDPRRALEFRCLCSGARPRSQCWVAVTEEQLTAIESGGTLQKAWFGDGSFIPVKDTVEYAVDAFQKANDGNKPNVVVTFKLTPTMQITLRRIHGYRVNDDVVLSDVDPYWSFHKITVMN